MAIKKCKECGKEVSTKAASCPNCGAKTPKKTSPFTWLVLLIILVGIYGSITTQTPTPRKADSNSVTSNKTELPKLTPPSKPEWTTTISADEMTGVRSAYANSPGTQPNIAMSFPYHNVSARLAAGCNNISEWAYIAFDDAPNLANTENESGYNTLNARIKWDNDIVTSGMSQKWQAKFLHFDNGTLIIDRMMNSSTALLELQWHGEQPAHFKFSLNGSTNAIKKIRRECQGF